MSRELRKFLVHDLETVPDPRLPQPAPRICGGQSDHGTGVCQAVPGSCQLCGSPPTSFPAPSFHQVVVIGYAMVEPVPMDVPFGHPPQKRYHVADLSCSIAQPEGYVDAEGEEFDTEPRILRDFTEHLEVTRPTLVGWNSRAFDCPVIAARCLVRGIPFPWYYKGRKPDPRYRYDQGAHYDVKDYLADFGGNRPASLDTVAKSIGLPGKVGVDGSMVAGMVKEGRLSEVADYCCCDVAQTLGVLYRTELLRGEITEEQYRASAKDLVFQIVTNPRLAALRQGIDMPLFTLDGVARWMPPSPLAREVSP